MTQIAHSITQSTAPARRPFIVCIAVYIAAVLLCIFECINTESKQSLMLAALVTLAPLGTYCAFRSPLIFPLCAYILVLPFDSLSSLGSGGTLAKLLGAMTAGALLLRLFRRGQALGPPKAVILWLCLLLWMGVSLFWAIDLRDGMLNFQMYASLIALFVLLSVVRVTPLEFNAVLGAVLTAGVISAGYDAYLYHSGQSLVQANAGVTRVIIAVGDSSIDPNALAAALILPASIALYWLFNAKRVVLSIVMVPVLTVLLLGFSASGSRGGFVELGIVFVYLIIRSRHRLWLLSLAVLATVTTLVMNPGLPARFAQAQADGGAGRRDIWHVGLYALRDYWFTGAGVGNFPNAFDREYINVYAQYVLGWHWVAHNVPLTIAVELGIVGSLLFWICVVAQFGVLKGRARDHVADYELRLTLEGAYLGIIVSGFSTSDLNAKYVWLAFSLMVLYRSRLLTTARNMNASPKPVAPFGARVAR